MITQSILLFYWNVLLFSEFFSRPWQGSMADGTITCPKMNPSPWIAFSSSGAKCIDSFQQGTSNGMSCLCQMLVQIIQQSVSSHSFLFSAIYSCFYLLAPLLSLSCFVEIVLQKIAAEQVSSDCAFLFFISMHQVPISVLFLPNY